jgi:hypothetical protein
MSRRALLRLALCPLAAAPLGAQRPAPVAAIAATPSPQGAFAWRAPSAARGRPRAWPYVVGGALVGAVATAGGIALVLSHGETECICSPIAFAPVIAGGAVLGAGAGYVVYRIRL